MGWFSILVDSVSSFDNDSNVSIRVENCKFKDCVAAEGGGIRISKLMTESALISGCTFDGCASYATGQNDGGAINLSGGSVFSDRTITRNNQPCIVKSTFVDTTINLGACELFAHEQSPIASSKFIRTAVYCYNHPINLGAACNLGELSNICNVIKENEGDNQWWHQYQ